MGQATSKKKKERKKERKKENKKERKWEKRKSSYYVLIFPADCTFEGSFPNDTVFCKEFLIDRVSCTNTKECCENANPSYKGCLNMSVIQGKKCST